MLSQCWGISDAGKRKAEFKSVYMNNLFIGFFRLHFRGGRLYLSLGLCPEYCGKGYGNKLIELVKAYAKKHFPENDLYLTVRDFNIRAIKAYQKSGFVIDGEHINNNVKYVTMKYRLSAEKKEAEKR